MRFVLVASAFAFVFSPVAAVAIQDALPNEEKAYGELHGRIVARVRLWPDMAPGETNALRGRFSYDAGAKAWMRQDVTCPELVVFRPTDIRSDTFLVDLPGGGYLAEYLGTNFITDKKIIESGRWLGILFYRVPRRPGRPINAAPREDLQRAVRWLRAHAAEYGWSSEKIGTIGYSAGGNLSVLSAVSSTDRIYEPVDAMDGISPHLNFAVAVYPAYLLDDGETDRNRNRGDGARLLPELKFDNRTPPMLLIHGDDDVYSSMGSVLLYAELHRRRVPAQLMVFSGASHGLNDKVNVRSWRQSLLDWLESRGL